MADYKVPILTGTPLTLGDMIRWDSSGWVNYADSNFVKPGVDLADGATIGQAAGPLLTFNNTLNHLVITGCFIGIGAAPEIVTVGLHIKGVSPVFRLEDTTGGIAQFQQLADGWLTFGNYVAGTGITFRADSGGARFVVRSEGIALKGGDENAALPAGTNLIGVYNGTAPPASITDGSVIYSADYAAGHACMHIRNEDGDIIKLEQQAFTAVSNPPTQAEVTAIRDALVNMGLMAAA